MDIQISALLQEIEAGLKRSGFIQATLPPQQAASFNDKVNEMRATVLADKHDPVAGEAAKQVGVSAAAAKNANLMEIARRIARELAANGPITVDDVTERLRKDGHESAADMDSNNRRYWKGGIFAISEWVCVGERPSRITANHVRPVKLWALKTWLAKNSLNGSNLKGSAFSVWGIMQAFKKSNPSVDMTECEWLIGNANLGAETAGMIKSGKYILYGAPVVFAPGAVGAVLRVAERKFPEI